MRLREISSLIKGHRALLPSQDLKLLYSKPMFFARAAPLTETIRTTRPDSVCGPALKDEVPQAAGGQGGM